jgi:hypothetical protein
MPKLTALPRPIGATALALAVALCVALAAPAASLAAPGPIALKVSPSPVSFGKATAGEKTLLEVDISNEGEAASIEKIAIDGGDAGDFGSSGNTCNSLVEGQHCTLTLEFKPTSLGAKQTTGLILFSGGARPTESFEISGTAVAPHLSFTPPGYDFGVVPTNSEAAQQTFQLENDGEAPVQVGNVELANYGDFWFDGNPSNACSHLMQPGESCSFQVYFGPGNSGSYSTQLRSSVGGEFFSVALSGEGARPEVEATPNPVEFGAATVGSIGGTRTVTVTNRGKVSTGFFIAVISGGDSASFRLLEETCTGAELQPGASCSAQIRFAPLAAGQKKATLSIFGDGDGGMQVQLRGEGVAPAVSISPSAFDFGFQARQTKSSAHTFAVRNEGATPVFLNAALIVGSNLDQFLLAGDECTGVLLGPGHECLVRLRFAPETTGAKTATLRIGSDAGAFTVPVTGLGIAAEKGGGSRSTPVLRFLRGASLSSGKARCRVPAGCRKARASKHGESHRRAGR